MLAYLHPVLGGVAALLVVWIGMHGLAGRTRKPDAPARRALHRRIAPVAGVLVWVAAIGGVASVAAFRKGMSVGDSAHFWAGWLVALLMLVAGAGSSLRPGMRLQAWHGTVGIVAMLLAALVFMMGLGLLP